VTCLFRIFCVAVLIFVCMNAAHSQNMLGWGGNDCRAWKLARTGTASTPGWRPTYKASAEDWVLGYLSALAIDHDWHGTLLFEIIMQHMDEYCEENPLGLIQRRAEMVALKLGILKVRRFH
jgi:hypothetical protein